MNELEYILKQITDPNNIKYAGIVWLVLAVAQTVAYVIQ